MLVIVVSAIINVCWCMVQTAVDVKQLELTQLTEQLAGVQHQLTITQQVT